MGRIYTAIDKFAFHLISALSARVLQNDALNEPSFCVWFVGFVLCAAAEEQRILLAASGVGLLLVLATSYTAHMFDNDISPSAIIGLSFVVMGQWQCLASTL